MNGWNVRAGAFFFKFRNALFPVIFLLTLSFLRPHLIFGNVRLDRRLTEAGIFTAIAGELLRLFTMGFDYIDRGGKNKQVAASRLVEGGVYGLSRNPMYVANMLIVTGICMAAGAPATYVLVIPFFLFAYQAIVCAEENFLRTKFGTEYDGYCARVPRFLPTFRSGLRSFAGMRYNWRRAVRQDLSTLCTVAVSLTLVPFWRIYFLEGSSAAQKMAARTAVQLLAVLAVYGALLYLKKSKRFFYEPSTG